MHFINPLFFIQLRNLNQPKKPKKADLETSRLFIKQICNF